MDDQGGPAPDYMLRMGQITPTTGVKLLLQADPTRRVLTITLAQISGSTALYLRSAGTDGFCFTVLPGLYSNFTYRDHGNLVTEALYSGGLTTAQAFSWSTISEV